ncbi:NAD(P)H-dependent amine dehydrogenase family protein [Neorhizobium tomejilense]|uniref:NAD(P)H-dependent amine dehydrogenase family protein n=1 Tax=Neorhizobium tomejilense TaxID=2093828 RepID=UPI003ECC70C1
MKTAVLFGVGAMGGRLLRVLEADYPCVEIVAAVDADAAKIGRTLADVTGYQRFGSVKIVGDLASALAGISEKPDVLVHMTESKPHLIKEQLLDALNAGLNVVSAAESMFYPGLRYGEFAEALDSAARANGVSITGTGINPGFSYDVLPLVLARGTSAVKRLTIHRCIDVTGTGPGDIEHVGYGLTPEEFNRRIANGRVEGHMGAPESLIRIADALNLEIDEITEAWDLETADFEVDSGDPTLGILPPGRVIGITQRARALDQGREVLSTSLAMYYQPEKFNLVEEDRIEIDGAMPVKMSIKPAMQSLFGAANIMANTIVPLAEAQPGLVSPLDLPTGGTVRGVSRYAVDPSRQAKPGYLPVTRRV